MKYFDVGLLMSVRALLRNDRYSELQHVPFAAHRQDYSAQHLGDLVDEEQKLLAAASQGEPVLYAYSLNPEHYARRLNRRQRLLGELFLYNRSLPADTVKRELPEYFEHVRGFESNEEGIRCPIRLVPVYDALCVADPLDAKDDAYVFLHNDSIQMARYLRTLPWIRGKRIADVGTGSGILAVIARKQGAAKVIAADINPRALDYARVTFALNECTEIELREGSVEDVVGDAEVIISNPPYMAARAALALAGGGGQGLDTALRFVRCAESHRRHTIMILELASAGESDPFLDELGMAPSAKHVLRRRPGYVLAAYEFKPE